MGNYQRAVCRGRIHGRGDSDQPRDSGERATAWNQRWNWNLVHRDVSGQWHDYDHDDWGYGISVAESYRLDPRRSGVDHGLQRGPALEYDFDQRRAGVLRRHGSEPQSRRANRNDQWLQRHLYPFANPCRILECELL